MNEWCDGVIPRKGTNEGLTGGHPNRDAGRSRAEAGEEVP